MYHLFLVGTANQASTCSFEVISLALWLKCVTTVCVYLWMFHSKMTHLPFNATSKWKSLLKWSTSSMYSFIHYICYEEQEHVLFFYTQIYFRLYFLRQTWYWFFFRIWFWNETFQLLRCFALTWLAWPSFSLSAFYLQHQYFFVRCSCCEPTGPGKSRSMETDLSFFFF